jgi:hypothetical protein
MFQTFFKSLLLHKDFWLVVPTFGGLHLTKPGILLITKIQVFTGLHTFISLLSVDLVTYCVRDVYGRRMKVEIKKCGDCCLWRTSTETTCRTASPDPEHNESIPSRKSLLLCCKLVDYPSSIQCENGQPPTQSFRSILIRRTTLEPLQDEEDGDEEEIWTWSTRNMTPWLLLWILEEVSLVPALDQDYVQ